MDFGIIVDGSVIVVENVFRKLSEASHGGRVLEANQRKHLILDAAVEVGRPTLFSMLIIIAAHIPIFTLQRHEGRIFSPMAYSVVSALVGALVLSLTLVPLLCSAMLKKNLPEHENFLVRAAKKWYDFALTAEAQALGARAKSYQTPSNVDAPIPDKAPKLSEMKLIAYDFAKYGGADERKRLIARWEKEVGSLPK